MDMGWLVPWMTSFTFHRTASQRLQHQFGWSAVASGTSTTCSYTRELWKIRSLHRKRFFVMHWVYPLCSSLSQIPSQLLIFIAYSFCGLDLHNASLFTDVFNTLFLITISMRIHTPVEYQRGCAIAV